jgi:hypothetical protein
MILLGGWLSLKKVELDILGYCFSKIEQREKEFEIFS